MITAPEDSLGPVRIGEAESSIERSAPLLRDKSSARRLRFTAAPLVSAWRTGSESRRRSVSSTRLTMASRDLPAAISAELPVSCSAAGFMKVM